MNTKQTYSEAFVPARRLTPEWIMEKDESHLQSEFERYYGSPIIAWERWEAWQWAIDALRASEKTSRQPPKARCTGNDRSPPCGCDRCRTERAYGADAPF